MTRFRNAIGVMLTFIACTPVAMAQWTNNPAAPLVIGDTNSDIPVMVPTADGGAFVAWQGTAGGNMWNTVHIQRLSPTGVELWGHNGIVAVAGNNSASFVGDFDIALASDGNLLVVSATQFTDALNPTIRQANVQKFAALDGQKMWGTGGADVAVSSGSLGGAAAHVAPMPDGGCVVGYTPKLANGNGALRFMRITPGGTLAWAAPLGFTQNGGNTSLSLVQMVSGGADSSFIALWGIGVNGSTVGLGTQKFTGGSGTTAGTVFSAGWGTTGNPIVIDPTGMTSYNYYQARMLSDGNGGAIYGWSSFTSGFAGCSTALLQHILSAGTIKFPTAISSVDHNLVPCGGSGTGQYSARVAFRQTPGSSPATYTYFMGSEQGPSASGSVTSALVQKFDDTGARMWSDSGVVVVPAVNSGPGRITPSPTADGGCVCIGNFNAGVGYGSNAVYAAKIVDDSPGFGMVAWRTIVGSDTSTGKGRLDLVPVAGSDDVIVSQSSGSVLNAFKVNAATGAPGSIPTPPSIDVDVPATITACTGDTITISVQVSGTLPMTFRWQRHYAYPVAANPDAAWQLSDGDSSFNCIVPADGTTYSGTGTATLTITNIHANDPSATCPNSDPLLNQYRVLVSNAASPSGTAATSSWAQVIVGSGACCAADGSCTSVCGAANCTGAYQGSGSVCSPNPCGGACCTASACTITTAAGCAASFLGNGTTCAPSPCPGACCDSTSGVCTEVPGANSCGSGSTFQAFTVCTPQPCPQPGACCTNGTGVCSIRVQSTCTGGSTFFGAGSTCESDPCAPTGACCSNIDGTYCFVLTESTCVGINTRRWQGAGTVCFPSPCPQQGACCNPSTGACSFVAEPGCAAGSTFQGAGLACDPNPCPQPAACCDVSTGACSVVASASQCGGQTVAAGSCQPNPCPTPIACCTTSGCTLSLPNFCGNPAPGGATTCSPSPCTPTGGTCCRGATCSTAFASAAACAAAVDTVAPSTVVSKFISAAAACNSPVTTPGTLGNTTSPCCYANFNHNASVEVQDIFDFLNDWFAGKKSALVGGDGTTGTLSVQNIFDFLNSWFAGGCN